MSTPMPVKDHVSGQIYVVLPQVYQQDGKVMRSFDVPPQGVAAAGTPHEQP
jgi:hypothetical protein